MTTKSDRFRGLVETRKSYFDFEEGFVNPSQIEDGRYDQEDTIDPWNRWHSSLSPEILVVGQDWGSRDYYIENGGMDSDSNPTCKNLRILFHEIGIDIGTPSHPSNDTELFFTNIIPGIRTGTMAGSETKLR